MVDSVLVLRLVLAFMFISLAHAKVDPVLSLGYLGEKNLEEYSGRWQPVVFQDIYRGRISFKDEIFFQNYFNPYIFQNESEYAFFLKSELNGGLVCSNALLSEHFEMIRYSYRLITLSYLFESQWHMKMASDHLRLKNGCQFDLSKWINSCKPKSSEMKKFVSRLQKIMPRYTETLPNDYKKNDWWNEYKKNDYKLYSQYRINSECKEKCSLEKLSDHFRNACEEDENVMNLICSEEDEVYGLSQSRDAYYLLGLSNIINTYNTRGEAMGCLRRFSELMAHKEVKYEALKQLFPSLQTFLRQKYQERFLQGRVFFFGASKEFEDKGLKDFYVKEQPMKVEKAPIFKPENVEAPKTAVAVKALEKVPEVPKPALPVKREPLKEISKPVKSAFLQAAEIRLSGNLDQVEVDMMKLRYDYVFSLNMINTLSERLKTFMTREALQEMAAYDKLGSKEGPVPLMFLKYMIDMQEHQGLWNIIAVLGDKFYVSNEIDGAFQPQPEFVQLLNNDTTGRQWQLFILRP